jgi:hypothetical protein
MLCLAQPWNGKPAGTQLGMASQINDLAGYTRLVMGWGDDPQFAGAKARQVTAAAVRREVRAIVPGRASAAAVSEERDGLGTITKLESGNAERGTRNAEPERGIYSAPRDAAPAAPSSEELDSIAARNRAKGDALLEEFERDNHHLLT